MRSLFAAFFVAACATAPNSGTPSERVAGCWIDRNADRTTITMRWLPDAEHPGALRGDLLRYGPTGAVGRGETLRLEQRGEGWSLCEVSDDAGACWQVAEGEGGSLEGGRAFIDAHGDRMRIAVVDPSGGERVIYHGSRDGCD